jgi:hypothetical protein
MAMSSAVQILGRRSLTQNDPSTCPDQVSSGTPT